MSSRLIVVIILSFIQVSNQDLVKMKLICQLYFNVLNFLNKKERGIKNSCFVFSQYIHFYKNNHLKLFFFFICSLLFSFVSE